MKIVPISGQSTIRSLVERSFIVAIFIILVATVILGFYLNQKDFQDKRNSNLQKIHSIMSNVILPALDVSEMIEVRRLLSLVSSHDEVFVVIDADYSILMPDYSKMFLVNSVINKDHVLDSCDKLNMLYQRVGSDEYWINCTVLMKEDAFLKKEYVGVLLSFSKNRRLVFSPTLLLSFGTIIFIFLFVFLWFRQVLYRHLLKPLTILGNRIGDKAKSPFLDQSLIGEIKNAPNEIVTIKQVFERLLENLQMEYKSRIEVEKKSALCDLAVQVAHDIRSPLTVMEMTLSSLSKYIDEENISIQRESIKSVRDIANNLLNQYREPIAHDADYGLFEDYDYKLVCINSLIEKMILQKRQEWGNYPCDISYLASPDARLIHIKVNLNNIKRMISNLLNNAYEALHDNRFIKLELNVVNDNLIFNIYDSGIGIPEEKISSVLLGNSLKHHGAGLGLSVAKRYMQSIGGDLQLTSVFGSGTRVMLSFSIMNHF